MFIYRSGYAFDFPVFKGDDCCLFSPLSFGPLSEVLLGKLQHVILAVMQRSLIHVSISKPVQRNPLKIQKGDINHQGVILFYSFCREVEKKESGTSMV